MFSKHILLFLHSVRYGLFYEDHAMRQNAHKTSYILALQIALFSENIASFKDWQSTQENQWHNNCKTVELQKSLKSGWRMPETDAMVEIGPWPLFTKRTDVLPQDLVKSRSHEIRV